MTQDVCLSPALHFCLSASVFACSSVRLVLLKVCHHRQLLKTHRPFVFTSAPRGLNVRLKVTLLCPESSLPHMTRAALRAHLLPAALLERNNINTHTPSSCPGCVHAFVWPRKCGHKSHFHFVLAQLNCLGKCPTTLCRFWPSRLDLCPKWIVYIARTKAVKKP